MSEKSKSLEDVQAERDEAYAILWALNNEYDKDDQCSYKKINQLIERGHVLLTDGPTTSKAYWDCWGGEGEKSAEAQAEYARYCDRAMETQRLRQELLELKHCAVSESTTRSKR